MEQVEITFFGELYMVYVVFLKNVWKRKNGIEKFPI